MQVDPSEDGIYTPGTSRRVFTVGALTFGVVICHEGWRYPETVRFAARHGAQVVFHPHLELGGPGGYAPKTFADPANTFHEKALLCRAAENTCFIASVNYAAAGSATTSAVVKPGRHAPRAFPVRRGGAPRRRPRPLPRDGPPRVAIPAGVSKHGSRS